MVRYGRLHQYHILRYRFLKSSSFIHNQNHNLQHTLGPEKKPPCLRGPHVLALTYTLCVRQVNSVCQGLGSLRNSSVWSFCHNYLCQYVERPEQRDEPPYTPGFGSPLTHGAGVLAERPSRQVRSKDPKRSAVSGGEIAGPDTPDWQLCWSVVPGGSIMARSIMGSAKRCRVWEGGAPKACAFTSHGSKGLGSCAPTEEAAGTVSGHWKLRISVSERRKAAVGLDK